MKLGIITSAAALGLVLGSLVGLSSSHANVPVSRDYSMTRSLIGFERGEPVVQAAPVIQASPVTIVAHKSVLGPAKAKQWVCSAPSRLMAGAEDTPVEARSSDTQTVRKCEWR
jgi:hypothetical protein